MKTNRGIARHHTMSGLAHLFLLVIVIFVAIGAIGYLAYQNAQLKKQAEDTTTPTESSETPNWETFTVPELSYSMQYPSNWKLSVSKSMGYPHIQLLDKVAQQVALPKTEIDQGALIQIYTESWLEKDQSISSLMNYLSIDPTVGLFTDPTATIEIKEGSVRQITGARSVVITQYYRQETFAFFRDHKDETLVYRIVLTILGSPEVVVAQTDRYLLIFQQMLNTLEFTSTE